MTSPEVYLQFRSADGLILEDSSSMLNAAKEICAIRKVSEEDFFEQLEITNADSSVLSLKKARRPFLEIFRRLLT